MPRGGKTGDSNHPTAGEMDERIEFTLTVIASGAYKYEIKRKLRAKYGNLSARTIERYIKAAYEWTTLENQRPTPELTAEAIAFYDAIIADVTQSIFVRMRARERKDKLLGLEQASKLHVEGHLEFAPDVADNGAPLPSLEEIQRDLSEAERLLKAKGRKAK